MQQEAEKLRDNRHYILDPQGHPIPALNWLVWGEWFQRNDGAARRVSETRTKFFWVSTVFLGLDHQWGDGPPLIFESMAFLQPKRCDIRAVMPGSPLINEGELCDRYSTRDQALAGHIAMVAECLALEAQHAHGDIARVLRRKEPSARAKKIHLKRAA